MWYADRLVGGPVHSVDLEEDEFREEQAQIWLSRFLYVSIRLRYHMTLAVILSIEKKRYEMKKPR